jgi:hypothetical protein
MKINKIDKIFLNKLGIKYATIHVEYEITKL